MADYMVGKAGGKDRYMVGWNGDSKGAYKVGVSGSGAQSSKSVGGDQDPVVGSKSAFGYKGEPDPKDVGDRSENMNFGGGSSVAKRPQELELTYSQSGDPGDKMGAMARKKSIADASKSVSGDRYDSPVPSLGKK